MLTLTRRLFDIRSGEGARAALMFAYIFLLIASLMIVKPARNSLFLSEFGAARLPLAYVAVAVVSAALGALYAGLARRIRLNRIIRGTLILSILSILVVWSFLKIDYQAPWFIFGFYIWVAIFGLITTTQFWLLANYVFNSREAKRLFGFIGAGGISGGIFGGYVTKFLAPTLGTAGMLHFTILFLILCIIILSVVWKSGARATYGERLRRQARQKAVRGEGSPLKLLLQSRLASFGAAIVGVGVVAASLVDYQFSAVAADTIHDPDELTAFFGMWMSNLSIISLAIQMLVTGRVLKGFGVGAALVFLPLTVLVGASAVFLLPGLLAVTALKVGEGGFKQSIHKAGMELLILPIPARLKNQIKSFIDVTVDNVATGLGGALLIVITAVLGWGVRAVSLLAVTVALLWIYLVIRVRREYIDAFRRAVDRRTIDPEDLTHDVRATVQSEDLIRLLESRNERHLIFALGFFESMRDERIVPHLRRLVMSPVPDVQRRTLTIARIHRYPDLDLASEANLLVAVGAESVQPSAIRYLCSRTERKRELLEFYLQDDSSAVQAAALVAAAEEWAEDARFSKAVPLQELFGPHCRATMSTPGDEALPVTRVRACLAEAIGIVARPELHECLDLLLKDSDPPVLAVAITSAGRTRDERFVGPLLERLADRTLRRRAREALSEYGVTLLPKLERLIDDPAVPSRLRVEIPRVLAMIGTQECADVLLDRLDERDLAVRFEIVRALNRIRTREPSIKIRARQVDQRVLAETHEYYRILLVLHRHRMLHRQQTGDGMSEIAGARQLLIRALREKLESNLERVFRLLGLRYVPRDIYSAYLGVVSDQSDLRANAVELLDLVLDPELKKYVIPIVEARDEQTLVARSRELFHASVPAESECLARLLKGGDEWLQACALYLIAESRATGFSEEVERLLTSANSIVRETARHAVRNQQTSLRARSGEA